MNSTIDESKEYIVGGGTMLLPNKDKILEMPEKEARDFEEVAEDTIIGKQLQEIKVGNARVEDILSEKQIKELKETRKKRKTKARILAERKEANQR